MALTTWGAFVAAHPEKANCVTQTVMVVKGVGANEIYMLEVDPATGNLPTSSTSTITFSVLDFGVTTAAPRMAAVLGNAAGAASWGAGTVDSGSLRVTPASDSPHLLATRHEAAATPLATRIGNGANFADFGAGANAATVLRTTPATDAPHLLATRHEASATPLAARTGNGTNFSAYGAGAVDATVQRTTPASDSPHLLATRHEASATPLATRSGNGTNFNTYDSGASDAATPRAVLATRHEAATTPLATRLGNGTNFSAFGAGAVGADVLRTTPASDSPHLLATRHEAAATPLSGRLGNGTNFNAYDSGASDATTPRQVLATRHEGAATPVSVRLSDGTNFSDPMKKGRTKANAPVRNDYTSTAVTTAAYVQLVASTTAACNKIQIFDSSGQTLVIATGGAGAEVDQFYVFPGGVEIDYAIAASARVSIKAVSATASAGEISINFLT